MRQKRKKIRNKGEERTHQAQVLAECFREDGDQKHPGSHQPAGSSHSLAFDLRKYEWFTIPRIVDIVDYSRRYTCVAFIPSSDAFFLSSHLAIVWNVWSVGALEIRCNIWEGHNSISALTPHAHTSPPPPHIASFHLITNGRRYRFPFDVSCCWGILNATHDSTWWIGRDEICWVVAGSLQAIIHKYAADVNLDVCWSATRAFC